MYFLEGKFEPDSDKEVSLDDIVHSRRRINSPNHSNYSGVTDMSDWLEGYDDEEDGQWATTDEVIAFREVNNQDWRQLGLYYNRRSTSPTVPSPTKRETRKNTMKKIDRMYAKSNARHAK